MIRLNNPTKLILFFLTGACVMFLTGGKAKALSRTYTTSASPGGYRTLCDTGVAVDFAAYPGEVSFDESTSTLSYNIHIRWQRCPGGADTRAFAIYGVQNICPPSGWYGVGNTIAYDCVKYIGSNPYVGPGNGLSCGWGYDGDCVTNVFGAVQKSEDQPNGVNEAIIPMRATNPLIGFAADTGSWSVGGGDSMCEYYKTGDFNNPTHNTNVRCVDVSAEVSWVPRPIGNSDSTANCKLVGWAYDGDKPDQSVYLDVWVDGQAEPSRHFYQANVPRPDVNAFGVSGNHGYVIDLSSNNKYWDGLPHNVDIWIYGINSAGVEDGGNARVGNMPATFTCPIHPLCGNLTAASIIGNNPLGTVEPGQQFSISVDVRATGRATTPIPFTVNVDVPGFFSGSRSGTIMPNNDSAIVNIPGPFGSQVLGTRNGSYTITFPGGLVVPNSQQPGGCTGLISIAAKPFFKATAGDVLSGFSPGAANCSGVGWAASGTSSRLAGWYDPTSNNGSGTTLAAVALNTITGFRSAQSQPPPATIDKLSFANGLGLNTFGGKYGGTLNCPKDYYTHTAVPQVNGSGPVPTSDRQASGTYTLTGGSLGSGTRSVLYVNGNVSITQDIVLNNSGVTDPAQLANFYLIVKGNIYISPNVRQLDGVYVAQGNGTTGKIYTCAFGTTPPTAGQVSDATNGCRKNSLTVNGAFIADKVNLYRGYGTLNTNQAAEIFNYIPTVWLAPPKSLAPLFGGTGTLTNNSYDAITTLQPVL